MKGIYKLMASALGVGISIYTACWLIEAAFALLEGVWIYLLILAAVVCAIVLAIKLRRNRF